MSATMLRASARSLPSLRRYVASRATPTRNAAASASSSSASRPLEPSTAHEPPTPSHGTLSPEKLRALISVYHSSENFITPENLSAAIDRAFIDYPNYRETVETSYYGLIQAVREQRRQPKVGVGMERRKDDGRDIDLQRGGVEMLWSQQRPQRELEVMNALLGTVAGTKPDLETLQDEYDRIEERLRREKA